jgi:MOSC domain-containing protein YiiM
VARIVSIAYTPRDVERRPTDRYARVWIERATLVEQRGIEGDVKGTGGNRQLNVMRTETLADLAAEGRKTGPGEMGEQLAIAGLAPADFVEGVRLKNGDQAVIEIGKPREPCERFAHIQHTTIESGIGKIGVPARVIAGGDIEVGNPVAVVRKTADG